MFQLSVSEFDNFKSQIMTSSWWGRHEIAKLDFRLRSQKHSIRFKVVFDKNNRSWGKCCPMVE